MNCRERWTQKKGIARSNEPVLDFLWRCFVSWIRNRKLVFYFPPSCVCLIPVQRKQTHKIRRRRGLFLSYFIEFSFESYTSQECLRGLKVIYFVACCRYLMIWTLWSDWGRDVFFILCWSYKIPDRYVWGALIWHSGNLTFSKEISNIFPYFTLNYVYSVVIGELLEQVEELVYLGSIFVRNWKADKENRSC